MISRILVVLFWGLFSLSVSAQEQREMTVSGSVLDADLKEPMVQATVQPLQQLDEQAKRIAEGHFDEPLPESPRRDSVGRLQNSFITMQRSLAQSVSNIRAVNAELEQHNDELTRAYQLKLETNRRKAAFIQDMYHEIRTPLNIICGFTQVLAASHTELPADEIADITNRISESATDITRLAQDLDKAANSN